MPKRGKKYQEVAKLVDRFKLYSPEEAIELAKKTSYTKFNSTVEVHMCLGVDPRHADQQVRGTVLLPHGTGRQVRVLVFAEGEAEKIAREAGADYVGLADLIKKIEGEGWVDFDMAIATKQAMGKGVGRLGKILGPRGLMPSPKTDTIVEDQDLPRVIKEAKQGRVEFRVDKTANLHVPIGKVNFTKEQLLENLATLMEAVIRAKPATAKGQYIKKVYLTTTMGPSIKVDPIQAQNLKVA